MAFAIAGTPTKLVTPAASPTYSTTLTYSGNTGAVTWKTSGMPDGLILTDNGAGTLTLAGDTPGIANGSYAITITGTDSAAATATKSYTLYVADPPSIDVSVFPATWPTGLKFAMRPAVTGGVQDAAGGWSLVTGGFPSGFTLNSNGIVSGSTSTAQTRTGIKLRYTDAAGQVADSATFNFATSASAPAQPLSIAWGHSRLFGTESITFTMQAFAGGGGGTYTYSIGSGALPSGISINAASGVVSGAPAGGSQGVYTFAIRASDGTNTIDTGTITLTVKSSLTIVSTISKDINPGDPFSFTFAAASGATPYTYSFTGTPPTGLALNTSTGAVSGNPSTPGTYRFGIHVHDNRGTPRTADATKIRLTILGTASTVRRWAQRVLFRY